MVFIVCGTCIGLSVKTMVTLNQYLDKLIYHRSTLKNTEMLRSCKIDRSNCIPGKSTVLAYRPGETKSVILFRVRPSLKFL